MQPVNPLCITGAHPDVRAEIEALPKASWDYMAIGLDAVDKYLWPILYMATFHPDEIPAIRARRESLVGTVDFVTIGHKPGDGVDICIAEWWRPSGSSALLGVQAALTRLGYRRVVLCGCPLEGTNDKGNKYASFRGGWEARKKELVAGVRSMSGWTREFLGAPTVEWLGGAL